MSGADNVKLGEPAFAALDAIGWLLRQVQENPDFYWLLFCTESLSLQMKAYAQLTGRPIAEVQQLVDARHFEARGLRPRAVVLEEQLEEARERIRALEEQLAEVRHVA